MLTDFEQDKREQHINRVIEKIRLLWLSQPEEDICRLLDWTREEIPVKKKERLEVKIGDYIDFAKLDLENQYIVYVDDQGKTKLVVGTSADANPDLAMLSDSSLEQALDIALGFEKKAQPA